MGTRSPCDLPLVQNTTFDILVSSESRIFRYQKFESGIDGRVARRPFPGHVLSFRHLVVFILITLDSEKLPS